MSGWGKAFLFIGITACIGLSVYALVLALRKNQSQSSQVQPMLVGNNRVLYQNTEELILVRDEATQRLQKVIRKIKVTEGESTTAS